MRTKFALTFSVSLLFSSCIVAVAPVHDGSAVVSKDFKDHTATFSFANLYDRDSSGTDKPGGIRMFLKMRNVGPMTIRMGQASISRDGGPWQTCHFGERGFNSEATHHHDYSKNAEHSLMLPNYFNVLVLSPSDTIPADRSKGYGGIDPIRRGVYRLRVAYTLNNQKFDHEIELKLGRSIEARAGTILDAVAPWSSMNG